MASELEVGKVKAADVELNATDYHLKLQDGAGNPWYLRAPDGELRMHLNGSGDALTFNTSGNITTSSDGIALKLDGSSNTTRGIFIRNTGGSAHGYLHTDGNLKIIAEDSGKSISFYTANDGSGTARLTIGSTGLATFSNGILTSEKGILSGTVLIADDAVTTITPARKGGFMKLLVDSATAEAGEYPQETFSGEVFFDCGTSLHIAKSTGMSSVDLDVSTSNVTGTTGTDGHVTIAVQAGVIKIENRSNGEKRFNYFLYC